MQNDPEEKDDPVSAPTITAGLQHLSEIQKVLFSVEHAEEMLGHVTNKKNFLVESYSQHFKHTEIKKK